MTDTAEADAPNTTETEPAPNARKRRLPKPKAKVIMKRPNVHSTISFPYRDLETGISVAQALFGAGAVALTTDQLAGVMNLQAGSGNFVVKTATARIFGLVSYTGGKFDLTELGFGVVDRDEKKQRQARAAAFLSVPLYRRVYDEFRGKPLPPRPAGLEQAFIRFGVSPKQKDVARQVFDKSAQQAGFFASGPDRLIEPIIPGGSGAPPRIPSDDGGNGNQPQQPNESAGPDVRAFHPFIQGLLDTLPEPETNWAVEGRAKWLQAAANIFDLIYKGSGEIHITAKPTPQQE